MTIKCTQKEFSRSTILDMPEFQDQRNTKKRLSKYLNQKDYDPTHPTIQTDWEAIRLNGKMTRGNGNTRAFGANNPKQCEALGKAPPVIPAKLFGNIWDCDTHEEALELYNSFDDTATSKGAGDRLRTALKFNNIKVTSKMYLAERGTSGLAIAWNALRGYASNAVHFQTEKMIAEFKPEVLLIDAIMTELDIPAGQLVVTAPGFQAAMLISLHKARHEGVNSAEREKAVAQALAFWKRVIKQGGKIKAESGLGSDAPSIKIWGTTEAALTTSKNKNARSRGTWFEITGKALYCFDRRLDDEISTNRRVELTTYWTPNKRVADVNGMKLAA